MQDKGRVRGGYGCNCQERPRNDLEPMCCVRHQEGWVGPSEEGPHSTKGGDIQKAITEASPHRAPSTCRDNNGYREGQLRSPGTKLGDRIRNLHLIKDNVINALNPLNGAVDRFTNAASIPAFLSKVAYESVIGKLKGEVYDFDDSTPLTSHTRRHFNVMPRTLHTSHLSHPHTYPQVIRISSFGWNPRFTQQTPASISPPSASCLHT